MTFYVSTMTWTKDGADAPHSRTIMITGAPPSWTHQRDDFDGSDQEIRVQSEHKTEADAVAAAHALGAVPCASDHLWSSYSRSIEHLLAVYDTE